MPYLAVGTSGTEMKRKSSDWMLDQLCDIDLWTHTHDLDFIFSRSDFVVLDLRNGRDQKQKEWELIGCSAHCVTLNFDQGSGWYHRCRHFCCGILVFTHGQFWPLGIAIACICLCVSLCVCLCVYAGQPWTCPRHNPSPLQAMTTKFGSVVKNTLVKIPIVLGGNCTWPSK